MTEETVEQIRITNLTLHPDVQVRVALDQDAIDRYEQRYREGLEMRPLSACRDKNGTIFIYDGWHRESAAKRAGLEVLPVAIRDGDLREARRMARFINNRPESVPLKKADRQLLVRRAIEDNPRSGDEILARECNGHHRLVRAERIRMSKSMLDNNPKETDDAVTAYCGITLEDLKHVRRAVLVGAEVKTTVIMESTARGHVTKAPEVPAAPLPAAVDSAEEEDEEEGGDEDGDEEAPEEEPGYEPGNSTYPPEEVADPSTEPKTTVVVTMLEGSPTDGDSAPGEAKPKGKKARDAKEKAQKEKPPVHDATGAVVPDRLRDVFSSRAIQDLESQVRSVQAQAALTADLLGLEERDALIASVKGMRDAYPHLLDVDFINLVRKANKTLEQSAEVLESAADRLANARPYAVCPLCKGEGCDNGKKAQEVGCRGSGFVPEWLYREMEAKSK